MLQILYTGDKGVETLECGDASEVVDALRDLRVNQNALITVFDVTHSGSMTSTRNVLMRALELENLENLLRY